MCVISYSTCFTKGFFRIDHKFDLMYVKFIHQYVGKATKEDKLYNKHEDIATLKKDYEEVGIISIKGEEDDERNEQQGIVFGFLDYSL